MVACLFCLLWLCAWAGTAWGTQSQESSTLTPPEGVDESRGHGLLLNQLLEATVRNYYRQYLGRDPLPPEADAWTQQLMSGNMNIEQLEKYVKEKEDACRTEEDCTNHGRCLNFKCWCDKGYSGTHCEVQGCPNNCNDRGSCESGRCICETGYTGIDCGRELSCPRDCLGRGTCEKGKCECKAGYGGEDCGTVVLIEVGEVGTINDLTTVPTTVQLLRTYKNPVVFAMPVSDRSENNTFGIVHVTNAYEGTFMAALMLEGGNENVEGYQPVGEVVHYLVMEEGSWVLPHREFAIEVGAVETNAGVGFGMSTDEEKWQDVKLTTKFDEVPVVLTQPLTNMAERFMHARQQNIGPTGFQVALEGASRAPGLFSSLERVGYMALHARRGKWGDIEYEAGVTRREVTANWYKATYKECFKRNPLFLAQMTTRTESRLNGHLRFSFENMDTCAFQVKIEDNAVDPEGRTAEAINFVSFGDRGLLMGFPAELVELKKTQPSTKTNATEVEGDDDEEDEININAATEGLVEEQEGGEEVEEDDDWNDEGDMDWAYENQLPGTDYNMVDGVEILPPPPEPENATLPRSRYNTTTTTTTTTTPTPGSSPTTPESPVPPASPTPAAHGPIDGTTEPLSSPVPDVLSPNSPRREEEGGPTDEVPPSSDLPGETREGEEETVGEALGVYDV